MTAFLRHSAACLGASLLLALPAQATDYTFHVERNAGWDAINNAGQIAGQRSGMATVWTHLVPTTLPSLGPSWSSWALGLNEAGQVVGSHYRHFSDGLPPEHMATLWTPGQAPVALGHVGNSRSSEATDINEAGQISGSATVNGVTGDRRAVRWGDGVMTSLDTAGGRSSGGTAINALGQVAGSITWNDGNVGAVVWTGTIPTRLDASRFNVAADINDQGHVVGSDGNVAYLWNGATVTPLDRVRPNEFGLDGAAALNERGQIVGASFINSELGATTTGVLWENGAATELNSLLSQDDRAAGWYLAAATDINDLGQIVGHAYNLNDTQDVWGRFPVHGFLLSPIPEPTSAALLLAGLGLVGHALRKRAKERSSTAPVAA